VLELKLIVRVEHAASRNLSCVAPNVVKFLKILPTLQSHDEYR
jgi:hypothetical protein